MFSSEPAHTLGSQAIHYSPIGHVETSWSHKRWGLPFRDCVSTIVLAPDLSRGLQGLRVGQEVLVVYHCHLSTGHSLLQHPQGDVLRPKRGVFALRTANRPNPIGITQVGIIAIAADRLTVWGLDALNGTPVLDIKPIGR